MSNYKTKEIVVNEREMLGVTLDEFPDTLFVIGAVKFEEVEGQLKLSYTYEVIEGETPTNKSKFENCIGDFIIEFIDANPNQLVYTGGT
jgi:hypothetical protein